MELVDGLIGAARDGYTGLLVSPINLGEAYYTYWRRLGSAEAERLRSYLETLPWHVVPVTESLVWTAARIKARHRMSYADCFAVATALMEDAVIVTGDPEIRNADHGVPVLWEEDDSGHEEE